MTKRPYTELLDQKIREQGFLILAHRGVSQGNIIENTIASMTAAFASGADAVEMDVAYVNRIGMSTTEKVVALVDYIRALPADKLMNMDRSWHDWETLLPYLDNFDIAERLLLKSPAKNTYLQTLSGHAKKYQFFAICGSIEEVDLALSYRNRINLVGIELITENDNTHDFLQVAYLQQLKQQGLYLMINALNLGNGIKLWGDYDDDTSVLDSPDKGWGTIIEQGIDIIDTVHLGSC